MKMKNRYSTFNAKIEVLYTLWGRVTGKTYKLAHKRKDEEMIKLVKQICEIPHDIMYGVLYHYLR